MKKLIKFVFLGIGILIILVLIDLITIFTINRPLFAIKEDNGDSTNLIYRGLFYDTYNCFEYPTPQIKSKMTKFTCTYKDFVEDKESKYNIVELENVSINVSEVSSTGTIITIKDTNKTPYTYGEWYIIEKNINGKWYQVKPNIKEYGFNSMGYLPDENDEVKFVINWEWLYGKLSLGRYRLLKQINNQYIGVEFDIEVSSRKKFEIIKADPSNLTRFNKYLEQNDRTIYLAGNLEEVYYYTDENIKISLKDYITTSYQTTDGSIKALTNFLKFTDGFDDGGTSIYRNKDDDITMVVCNTIMGNKNVFIGDYSMDFDDSLMCE